MSPKARDVYCMVVRPKNYDAFLLVDRCPTIDIAYITRESEGDINATSDGRECSHNAYKQWMQVPPHALIMVYNVA